MNTEIAEYSPTAAALAELRQKYEKAVYDTSTVVGMAKAVAARRELREVRVNLEKLRKELKAPALERSRLIDAEAKALTTQIEAMEDPIDAQIKAEEERKAAEKAERERIERERLEALHRRVADIRAMAVGCVGASAENIRGQIVTLEQTEIDESFGEMQADAATAKEETLTKMESMHAATVAAEAEAERLRIEHQKLEAARKAQEEQAARDRAELAKLRAEQEAREQAARAEMEKQQEAERQRLAAERAEQERLQAIEDAKRAQVEAEARAKREAEQREIERQRAEIEEQRRKVEAERLAQEEAARKVQSGYQMLESFVERFGADKEFQPIVRQINKWLDGKKEQVAA